MILIFRYNSRQGSRILNSEEFKAIVEEYNV